MTSSSKVVFGKQTEKLRTDMSNPSSYPWRKLNFSISLKKEGPWKKSHFFRAHFSCEQDWQTNFKFAIDSDVCFIYRLLPRKPNFLGWLASLIPLQLVALWMLLGAFTVAYNLKVLVSGYPSIDMHCIVLPVKYDGGLSISFLRIKQLLKKKLDVKSCQITQFFTFQTSPFEERTDLCLAKSFIFGRSFSLWMGLTTQLQIWHEIRSAFYLSNDIKKAWFPQMTCHLWYHFNWSLSRGFSERSRSYTK
jgi:hypothetical protein